MQGEKSQAANLFISDDYLQEKLIGPPGRIERLKKASFLIRCFVAQWLADSADDRPAIGNDKQTASSKRLNVALELNIILPSF